MPESKKRKLGSESEAMSGKEGFASTSTLSTPANNANAEPPTEAAPEENPGTDDAPADKVVERQARFKALQARAV